MKTTTYRLRSGKSIPVMCDETSSQGVVVFFFGTETRDVYLCSKTKELVTSDDASLVKDSDNSIDNASYKAYPEKEDGDIVYNSVLQTKVVKTNEYPGPVAKVVENG